MHWLTTKVPIVMYYICTWLPDAVIWLSCSILNAYTVELHGYDRVLFH